MTFVPGTAITWDEWQTVPNDVRLDPHLCSMDLLRAGKAATEEHTLRLELGGQTQKVNALKFQFNIDEEPVAQLASGDAEKTRAMTRVTRIVSDAAKRTLYPSGGPNPNWVAHMAYVVNATLLVGNDPDRNPAVDASLGALIMCSTQAPRVDAQGRLIEYLTFQASNFDQNDDFVPMFAARNVVLAPGASAEEIERHKYLQIVQSVEGYGTCLAAYMDPAFVGVFDPFILRLRETYAIGLDLKYLLFIFFEVLYAVGNRLQNEAQYTDGFDHKNTSEWVAIIKTKLAEATAPARCNQASQNASASMRALVPKEYTMVVSSSKKRGAEAASSGNTASPKGGGGGGGKAARTTGRGSAPPCLAHLTFLARSKKGSDCAYGSCAFDHAPAEIMAMSAINASKKCIALLRGYRGKNSALAADLEKGAAKLEKAAQAGSPKNPYV